ncbi:MAG: hypothetical protein AAGF99_11015 [Bacteroidota bacterium]
MNAQTNGHTPHEAPRRDLIPPHIAWPLFVVLLLSISVSAAIYTAFMAHADGGVQVIDSSEYAPER